MLKFDTNYNPIHLVPLTTNMPSRPSSPIAGPSNWRRRSRGSSASPTPSISDSVRKAIIEIEQVHEAEELKHAIEKSKKTHKAEEKHRQRRHSSSSTSSSNASVEEAIQISKAKENSLKTLEWDEQMQRALACALSKSEADLEAKSARRSSDGQSGSNCPGPCRRSRTLNTTIANAGGSGHVESGHHRARSTDPSSSSRTKSFEFWQELFEDMSLEELLDLQTALDRAEYARVRRREITRGKQKAPNQ